MNRRKFLTAILSAPLALVAGCTMLPRKREEPVHVLKPDHDSLLMEMAKNSKPYDGEPWWEENTTTWTTIYPCKRDKYLVFYDGQCEIMNVIKD